MFGHILNGHFLSWSFICLRFSTWFLSSRQDGLWQVSSGGGKGMPRGIRSVFFVHFFIAYMCVMCDTSPSIVAIQDRSMGLRMI